jgi:hypothetical protein
VTIAFLLLAIAVLLLVLVVQLALVLREVRRPRPTPVVNVSPPVVNVVAPPRPHASAEPQVPNAPEEHPELRSHVRAAILERLEHEESEPERHPPDLLHRQLSVLQRAQRRIRRAGHPEPENLAHLVNEELRRQE